MINPFSCISLGLGVFLTDDLKPGEFALWSRACVYSGTVISNSEKEKLTKVWRNRIVNLFVYSHSFS